MRTVTLLALLATVPLAFCADSRPAQSRGLEPGLPPEVDAALATRGFAVLSADQASYVSDAYYMRKDLPVFVTADSVLHVFYSLADDVVAHMEKEVIAPELRSLLGCLTERASREHAPDQARVFVEVAARLMDPEHKTPPEISAKVAEELSRIGRASEPRLFPGEDYTQYKPRGHYAQDPELARLMQTLMWLGRRLWRVDDDSELRTAAWIAELVARDPHARQSYERLLTLVERLAGPPDAITLLDLGTALGRSLGDGWRASRLDSPPALEKLQAELAAHRYRESEMFAVAVADPIEWPPKSVQFLPQAWTPDGWTLQRTAMPFVPSRLLSSGLDAMAAVYGSSRAEHLLGQEMKEHPGLEAQLEQAGRRLASPAPGGADSLHRRWLTCLEPLLAPAPDGAPEFMGTGAWADLRLNTALAAWTELRHTVLPYAKPAYTALGIAEELPRGAVDPVPELFSRLSQLTKDMGRWLEAEGALTQRHRRSIAALASWLDQCREIADAELEGRPLTGGQLAAIDAYGDWLAEFFSYDLEQRRAELVVDVATASVPGSPEHGSVLHEATGRLQPIYVVWPFPDVPAVLRGYVMSYYEFTEPSFQRLTDEEWRDRVIRMPARPSWTASFLVGDPTKADAKTLTAAIWQALEEGDARRALETAKLLEGAELSEGKSRSARELILVARAAAALEQGEVSAAAASARELAEDRTALNAQHGLTAVELDPMDLKRIPKLKAFDPTLDLGLDLHNSPCEVAARLSAAAEMLHKIEQGIQSADRAQARRLCLERAELLEVISPEVALGAYRELARDPSGDEVEAGALAGVIRLCAPLQKLDVIDDLSLPPLLFSPRLPDVTAALGEARSAALGLMARHPRSEQRALAEWTAGILALALEADEEETIYYLTAYGGAKLPPPPGQVRLLKALGARHPELPQELVPWSDPLGQKWLAEEKMGMSLARRGQYAEAARHLEAGSGLMCDIVADALGKPADFGGDPICQFVAAVPVTVKEAYLPREEVAGRYLSILKAHPGCRIAFQIASAVDLWLDEDISRDAWETFLKHNEGRDPVEDAVAHAEVTQYYHPGDSAAVDHWKAYLRIYLSFGRDIPPRLEHRMRLYGEETDEAGTMGITEQHPIGGIAEGYAARNDPEGYRAYLQELERDYGPGHPIVGLGRLGLAALIADRGNQDEAIALVKSVAVDFSHEPVCVEEAGYAMEMMEEDDRGYEEEYGDGGPLE